jgi:integrase/recombinase XerD
MMKYSVKLLLFDQVNSDGNYPIYIRITINRQRAYISTGHFLAEKYWDSRAEQVRPAHSLAGQINPDIASRKQAIIKKIVDYQVKGERVTAAQIKALFTKGIDLHNIFDFTETFIKEVQHKREPGTLENYRKHLKVVELFHGSRSLAFEEITHEWLVDFEDHLRKPVAGGVGKRDALGGNYIYIIFKTLKTFFNAAKKRGVITCYPFTAYENPVYEAPQKDYLTLKELDKLEELADKTTHPVTKQTVVYFLLGCYSGLRLSDWFQFRYDEHVKDGKLYIRAKKNDEWVTMPIVGRLKRHLERVKTVPLQVTEQEMNRTLKNIAGIKKRITTHCGRHTFAVTICSEQGISAEVCAELMGIKIDTCVENYYKITNKKIDKEVNKAWANL